MTDDPGVFQGFFVTGCLEFRIDLNFTKPFEAHNKVVFTIQPQAGGSVVSWDMSGPAPLMARVMHVFFNMDKMVGKDFEDGLAAMKAAAEKQS